MSIFFFFFFCLLEERWFERNQSIYNIQWSPKHYKQHDWGCETKAAIGCSFSTWHWRPMAGSAQWKHRHTIFSQIQAGRPLVRSLRSLIQSKLFRTNIDPEASLWRKKGWVSGRKNRGTICQSSNMLNAGRGKEETTSDGCFLYLLALPDFSKPSVLFGWIVASGILPWPHPILHRFAPFPIKANQIKSIIIITNST